MFRAFIISSLAAAPLFAFAAACSSSSETTVTPAVTDAATSTEEDAGAARDATPKEAAAACELAVGTNVAVCDDCLQKNCCVVVNDCFGDPDCEKLNTCYAGCYSKPADAGEECVKACIAAQPAASQRLLDMLECQNKSCAKACKG